MKILCLVDFSESSKRALLYAADMAEILHASMYVLHVFRSPVLGYRSSKGAPHLDVPAATQQAADETLHEWVAELQDRDFGVTGGVVTGSPVQRVVHDVAQELGSDLIVMGTHGMTGIQRLLLGSTTDKVIRTSNIPVVAVPSTED